MKKFSVLIILSLAIITLSSGQKLLTLAERSNYHYSNDYPATLRLCHALDSISTMVHMDIFGKSSAGYDLPFLIVDRDGLTVPQQIKDKGRAIIMIQADIHAGEPEGNDAGFILVRDLITNRRYVQLLDHVSIIFIPVLNADGLSRLSPYNRINQNGPDIMGWRANAMNLNLNRDYLKADAPEIRAWIRLFNQYLPDFFVDCHTTDGADYQYVLTYALPLEFQLTQQQYDWVYTTYLPYVTKKMYGQGIPIFQYISFRRWADPTSGLVLSAFNPMYSTGYVWAQNRPSLLIETHMLKDFRLRLWATYYMLLHTIEAVSSTADKLIKINLQADKEASRLAGKKYTLQYKLTDDTVHVQFLGKQYHIRHSGLTGGNYVVYSDTNQTITMPLWNKYQPDRSITVPEAYIIPVQWTEVIKRLLAHGIKFYTIEDQYTDSVFTYRFSNIKFACYPYEGHQRVQSFTTEKVKTGQTFRPGSIIVPIGQRAAQIIIHLLEPEAPSSLLSWGFFNPIFEQKEYAEIRVMERLGKQMLEQDTLLGHEWTQWKATHPNASQWQQINWLYQHSPCQDPYKDIYPVGMIYSRQKLNDIVKKFCYSSK